MLALEHITTEGERWDAIAWRYYGDPHRYSEIIQANPAAPIAPTLPSGLRLVIPVLDDNTTVNESLPPWKR